MKEILDFPIAKIKVGDRYREAMGDIKSLAASIDQKGQIQPIGINQKHLLLWGGRRLEAIKRLKLTTIKAVVCQTAGELDELEIQLLENDQRKDFTWQEKSNLEAEIFEKKKAKDPSWSERKQAAVKDEPKTSVNRRIRLAEAMQTIPELAKAKNEAAAWKQLQRIEEDAIAAHMAKQAKAKRSTAFTSGENHFIIEDAFKGMEAIKSQSYHLIECDPPYAIDLGDRKSRNKDTKTNVDRYTEIDKKVYPKWFRNLAEECFRLGKKDSFAVFWFGMDWYDLVTKTLKEVGYSITIIPAIWYKGQQGQTASPDVSLGSSYETFIVARKGAPKLRKAGRSNVFSFPPVPPSKKIHATMKPLDLMIEIMQTFTFPGANVFIPFLGSGVSMYAAMRCNMLPHGFEIDKLQKTRYLAWVEKIEGEINGAAAATEQAAD